MREEGTKKTVALLPQEENPDDSNALAVVEKVAGSPPPEKSPVCSADRDAVLARVETEKRMSLIKAWLESEKTKVENKAQKEMSSIASWENTKKELFEKKKAEHAEKMMNKIAMIHKAAEEKRATVEAKRGEDTLKAEETAAKYRATGLYPKKGLGCFSA